MSLPSQLVASVLIAASSPIRSTRFPLMRVPIKLPASCSARFKTRSARPIPSPCQAATLASRQARFLAIMSESPSFAAPSATARAAALYSCKALRLFASIGLGIAVAISATVLVVQL